MKAFRFSLAAMMLLAFAQTVRARTVESAPQEPPYTQEESEFDKLATPIESAKPATPTSPTDDVFSIENELKSAQENISTVTGPKKEESTRPVEEGSAVIPVAPIVEVQPAKEMKSDEVVHQSPKGRVEYIHHPQAAKGLLMIEKDGTYIYKTKGENKFSHTGTFRAGMMDAPTIISKGGTTNFTTMYHGSPLPVFIFDYEWQPFTSFGRLGIQAGLGFLIANGNGRISCDGCSTDGKEAKEKYTFLAVPLNLGGVYRLEWTNHQWLAPYVSAGGAYVPVVELRDDNASPKSVGTPGAYGATGLMFNISAMDRSTAFILRTEYGIANLWLSAEYRYLKTFNNDLNFSSNILTLGIGADY